MRNSTPLPFFFVLLFLSCVNSQSAMYDQEHSVLLRMKQYFQNPSCLIHWTQSGSSHCSWTEITCNNNSVTGLALVNINITQPIPTFICELKNLTSIDFQWNFIPLDFPTYLYKCSKLEDLDLSNNFFVGKLPEDVDRLAGLRFLNLGGNNFSGEIPVSITRLKLLTSLQLNQCQFNGTIPSEIGSLSDLEVLDLRLNTFSPSVVPSSFTKLTKLKNFFMSDCNLVGEIPESIGELVGLEILDLSMNQLTGKIPSSLFTLKNLSIMFLSRNQLSGELPQVIEALNFTIIDLARNNLTGKIPNGFGNLHKLTGLNFALNQLSGQIPESLGRLQSIIDFRVFINNLWRFRAEMTDYNIIGSGGYGTVYRIAINDAAGYVAVKKISNNRKLDQKLENSFHAELEILSAIRHINIVKLLCCMSKEDLLLLVYEYMENLSLDKWLHKKNINGSSSSAVVHRVFLDWPKRSKIAIDIAQGLSYMHHDNSQPIIHRDVKPSNILLDSQFNAKVADFGLARMLIKQRDTMSTVAGSFGYIAPEYARTKKVNEKVDVYGFGVILLELTTGKEATYGDDQHSSLAEWASQFQPGSNIEQVLDEEVKEASFLENMCNVFKLGVLCTDIKPGGRPSMKEALNILLKGEEPSGYAEMKFCHSEDLHLLKKNSSYSHEPDHSE